MHHVSGEGDCALCIRLLQKIIFVSKMDTYSDCLQHESNAKRLKLDTSESNIGASCNGTKFPSFPTSIGTQIGASEGISLGCDSGYEAPTMELLPNPLVGPIENLDDTPTYPDTSQDSIEADDDDDNASTVSELSGLSDLSGQDWKPMGGSMTWIQKQMQSGTDPRALLVDLGVELDQIPQYVDDVTLWKLIINMLAEPPRRHKLRHVNTLDDIVRLLKGAKNIVVLTGAGVSVSCGIPDFRSRDGIYSRLAIDFPDLPDPQAMFDISYFSQDPRPFFKFAKDIYPGKFQPSPCHRFIKLLEKHNKLLRNYTQNIDTLEKVADIKKVIECHGSFARATCTKCGFKVSAEAIREIVLSQNIPVCDKCQPNIGSAISISDLKDREPGELRDLVSAGIMKPDIVFFGEGLPDSFHDAMSEDKNHCDLLVVIGSSLKVRPVALIPSSLPSNVPQILINREPLPHCHFDVELLGDCDVIINHLCHLLGGNWQESIYQPEMLKETLYLLPWKTSNEDGDKKRKSPKKSASQSKTPENIESTEPISNKNNICNCSTKSSSLLETDCSCNKESIICESEDNSSDLKSIKERHMSVDSARDSGIGENSNFTDVDTLRYDSDELSQSDPQKIENRSDSFLRNYELEISSNGFSDNLDSNQKDVNTSKNSFTDILDNKSNVAISNESSSIDISSIPETTSDLRGYWQPKEKRCITERLPKNSYYLIQPSRYIFPGAELFFDPDEKCSYFDNSSSDSSSDSDTDVETPDTSF